MRPALVILAGGASQRLGTCKALVEFTGRSVLEHLVDAGRVLVPPPPLVVTGRHDAEIRAALPEGAEVVTNPAWERGRTGSVACAVRARARRDLVLAPVDVPRVPPAVFDALAAAWTAHGSPPRGWLAPLYRPPERPAAGVYGHPVVLGAELAAEVLEMDPAEPLRVLRRRADPLLAVPVPHPEIGQHLDTPEDLTRLQALAGGDADSSAGAPEPTPPAASPSEGQAPGFGEPGPRSGG